MHSIWIRLAAADGKNPGGRKGNEYDVVLIATSKILPFFSKYADHGIGCSPDTEKPSNRIVSREQLACDGIANDGHLCSRGEMLVAEPMSTGKLPLACLKIIDRNPSHQCRPVQVPNHRVQLLPHERCSDKHGRDFSLECSCISCGEGKSRPHLLPDTLIKLRARPHKQQIRSERIDLL